MKETKTTPYLLRAMYEWCIDNRTTPYIVVKVDEQTQVPMEYVTDDEIVLNIGSEATKNLKISNDLINFAARFSGVSREVSVPVSSVKSIFAKETGRGMAFDLNQGRESEDGLMKKESSPKIDKNQEKRTSGKNGRKSHLQVVK